MSELQSLQTLLHKRIKEAGGFIPFDHFMEAALYEPGLGYYESQTVFGEQGDFVTASDLGPWLALGLADLMHWGWQQLGSPEQWILLEQGSGSGTLLVTLLDLLAQFSMPMPIRILSVEKSAQLRCRQQQVFQQRGFTVEQHEALTDLSGLENLLAYSNELPDAFPVRAFGYEKGVFYERGVGVNDEGFCWLQQQEPLADAPEIAEPLVSSWPDHYQSEWNPHIAGWQQQMAEVMARGLLFTIDYGYAQQEYYRPSRQEGTLLAHLKQQAVHDLFSEPGSRDITAHVDFSVLVRAGRAVGFTPHCWISQGGWLAQSASVQAFIQSLAQQQDASSMHLMAHAKRMLLPYGMGELFKMLVQSKGVEASRPAYLRQFDHLDQL